MNTTINTAQNKINLGMVRISGTIGDSIVDGPGLRFVIFAQGCFRKCKGCHNPESFDLKGGKKIFASSLLKTIDSNPLIFGVTFSGGEPFLQAEVFWKIAKACHKRGLDVITYTGYTIEEFLKNLDSIPFAKELLEETDTLVDGPFVLNQKSLLRFRGSKNQRFIDSRASLKEGRVVEKIL
ncbi:MAG: radical SAM protein [Oscillospiraceae bacterium]|jgi:anaerobic ribonucleoside-triphosphate reductase activating protein|nr:radical SAM protein [Oscillospiraceae bacterium]